MGSYPAFGGPYRNPYAPQGYPNFDWSQNHYQPFPGQPYPNPNVPQPHHQPTVPFIPPSEDDPPRSSKKKTPKRSSTLPGSSSNVATKVLKSALKKIRTTDDSHHHHHPEPQPEPQFQPPAQPKPKKKRVRAQSEVQHEPQPEVQPEAQELPLDSSSSPTYSPDQQQHLYVVFKDDDELKVSFCSAPAIQEIRNRIYPLWPDGVAEDKHTGWEWRVRFNGTPWKSHSSARAYIIIVELFDLFATRGYAVQGALNISSPTNPPKFVFVATCITHPKFFALYISRKSIRATIVLPPSELEDQLEPKLRRRIGSKLATDRKVDPTLRILELQVDDNGNPVMDPTEFLMQLMSTLAEIGFDFEACIPLGKKRTGSGSQRELLVFRSTQIAKPESEPPESEPESS